MGMWSTNPSNLLIKEALGFATQYLLCSRLCYKFMSIHRSINCLVYHYPLPHPSCLKLESGVTIHSCTSCSIDPFMQDLNSHYNTYCVVHCVISYPSSNCGRIYLHCRSCEVEYSSSHSEPFNNVWQSGTQSNTSSVVSCKFRTPYCLRLGSLKVFMFQRSLVW